jgi:hypothetical protein
MKSRSGQRDVDGDSYAKSHKSGYDKVWLVVYLTALSQ